jgi:hypothetical protein
LAGNSGYSFGTHVHVQVTRSKAISSVSIPFRFQDVPAQQQFGYRGPVVSTGRSSQADCAGAKPDGPPVFTQTRTSKKTAAAPPDWTGSVGVASWWNEFLAVPAGSASLAVRLDWDREDRDLDLHLVSPSGRHFGLSFGEHSGLTSTATEESFQIANPESGTWRVSVQGMRGDGEAIPFRIYRTVEAGKATAAASGWGGARRRD